MSRPPDSETKGILKDASLFSGATYFSQIMCYLRGFLNARFLNPAGYGLWSAFNIFIGYGDFSHLGVLQGMNREIAYVYKKDRDATEKIRNASFSLVLINSLILSSLMILLFLIFKRPLQKEELAGILTVGVLVVMNNLIVFFEMNNSAIQNFLLISKINFNAALISLVITLPFVFYLRIYGVFLVAILTALYSLFFYSYASGFSLKFDFDRPILFKLFRIGFPLIVIGLFGCVRYSINSLMILGYAGKAALGLYAVANLLSQFLVYFPYTVGQVILPRLYQRYSDTKDVQDLKKYLIVPTQVLSYLLPLIAGLFYFLFSFLIRMFLPAYIDSVVPLFWLLFAFGFIMMPTTATGFATALDRQHILVVFNLLAIFINLISNYLFLVIFGLGIKGVALTVLMTFIFYTTCVLSYNLRFYFTRIFEYLKYFSKLYLPTAYLLLITFVINRLFGPYPVRFFMLVGRVFYQVLIYLILSLPVLILLNRQTRFFKWVKSL